MNAANITNPQSLNLYGYCGNDPVNRLDPEGLFFGAIIAAIAAIIGAIAGAIVAVAQVIWVYVLVPAINFIGGALLTLFEAAPWLKPFLIPHFAEAGAAAWKSIAFYSAMAGVGAVRAFMQAPSRKVLLERQSPKANPCPPDKRRFFDWLLTPLTKLAKELDTNSDFLLAHAAKEAGWTMGNLDHNQPLNNPFGVNRINSKGQAAGNVKYSSLDAALDDYKQRYGHLKGAKTMEDFAYRVKHLPDGRVYNTNPKYEGELRDLYPSVLKFKKLCGIQ
jgi:hypothetical protein